MKVILILLAGYIRCSVSCTFPSDLIGNWYSPTYGTLTFTNSSFSGFKAISMQSLNFTCKEASGSRYLAYSSYSIFANVYVDAYLCLNLQRLSSIKYVFTLNSNLDSGTGVRFYTGSSTATLQEACAYTDTMSPGEYELLIKQANISQAFVSCPQDMQTIFDVTMTTASVSNCNGTTLNGENDTLLTFNYSTCAKGTFNTNGSLTCLYYKTNGYTYVSTYNKDTKTDEKSTFKYTCIVYEKSGATIKASEHPKYCHYNQTPTAVVNPGITYVMNDLLYITTSQTDGSTVTIIIVICCVVGGILIITVIIIVLYCKVFKKKAIEEIPENENVNKQELLATEYAPKKFGRSKSGEKINDGLHKQNNAENGNAVVIEDAYEKPPKEVSQKQLTKGLPQAISRKSQKSSRHLLTSGKITATDLERATVLDLEKAYTLSTSLPESLDLATKIIPPSSIKPYNKTLKDSGKSNSDYIHISAMPDYLRKYQSLPKLPHSTGKFGGQPELKLVEPVYVPISKPNLDTISENPLSRENTSAFSKNEHSVKPITKHPNKQIAADGVSLSTVLTTRSIVSAGDVTLQTSFRNLNRVSHLSASNATIFDDPTWLVENTKITDKTFDTVKNLLPSVPKIKQKNHTQFTKSPKKINIVRTDMDYFKNKTTLSTGLSSCAQNRTREYTSSLHVVLEELKRRKRNKAISTKLSKTKLVKPAPSHSY